MSNVDTRHLDFIEELKLRRWARLNYVPLDDRDTSWDPVILDEMRNADRELTRRESTRRAGVTYVPLEPSTHHRLDGPHRSLHSPSQQPATAPAEFQF